MAGSEAPNGIVLFHYNQSPYARRVRWYLAFRKIAYAECIQPRIMPRPDLAALGVQYRRTPSMAIGRDVYLDTRLIISRLEHAFPASPEHPGFSTPATAGLAKLLNKLNVDASLFSNAVTLLPPQTAQDPAFSKDRSEFFGKNGSLKEVLKLRHEGLVHARECFAIIEELLSDGRKWVGGDGKPTLADLEGEWVFPSTPYFNEGVSSLSGDRQRLTSKEGVWVIDWIISDLRPKDSSISETAFPLVYKWRNNFKTALEGAVATAPKVVRLKGEDAVSVVLGAEFSDKELVVDGGDPFQIPKGTLVTVFPTDGGGFTHKDQGHLIKLTAEEVAIAVRSGQGDAEVHVHAPRWKFRIQRVDSSKL